MSGKESRIGGSDGSRVTRRRVFATLGAASMSALVPLNLAQNTVAAASDDELLRTIDVDTAAFDGLEDGSVELYAGGRATSRFSGTLGHSESGYSYAFRLENHTDDAGRPTPDAAQVTVKRVAHERLESAADGTGPVDPGPIAVPLDHSGSDDEGDYEGTIEVEGWDCWSCKRQVQNNQSIRWQCSNRPDWVERHNSYLYSNDTEYDWKRNDSRSNYNVHFFDDHVEGADTDDFVDQRENDVEFHIESYLRGEGYSGDMSWDVVCDQPNWEWDHKVKVSSDAYDNMNREYRD